MPDTALTVTDPHALATTNGQGTLIAGRPPALTPTAPVGQLAKALARAQQKVRAVPHDAKNQFHKYEYTSSEAIIEAAKDALAESDLAVLPLEETLNSHAKEGEDRFELVCKFLLIHSSSESVPLLRHWPVCPDKGRPLDKATAAAATLALSYLLRDLLLMPRVNQADEVAARDDRVQQQQARRQTVSAEEARLAGSMLAEMDRDFPKFAAWLANSGFDTSNVRKLSDLTNAMYRKLVSLHKKHVASKASKANEAAKAQTSAPTPAPAEQPGDACEEGIAPDEPSGPDPSEIINKADAAQLSQLLKQKGKVWGNCIAMLRLPGNAVPGNLSYEDFWALCDRLNELPDATKSQPQKAG